MAPPPLIRRKAAHNWRPPKNRSLDYRTMSPTGAEAEDNFFPAVGEDPEAFIDPQEDDPFDEVAYSSWEV